MSDKATSQVGMSRVKTAEATHVQLNWLVAKIESVEIVLHRGVPAIERDHKEYKMWLYYQPTTDWSQGGPIIEREGITLSKTAHGFWEAYKRPAGANECYQVSDDPLIAAMRCYVASKLGDEVDVPSELL